MGTLHFSEQLRQRLSSYIPPSSLESDSGKTQENQIKLSKTPFLTLTYAQSLDGQISLSSTTATVLSGPSSKAMTHFLRSVHDAILVGSGTAITDDPSLNCRLDDVVSSLSKGNTSSQPEEHPAQLKGQPRPVILDRRGRWQPSSNSKVIKLAEEGRGHAPWIFISGGGYLQLPKASQEAVTAVGGQYFQLDEHDLESFDKILAFLSQRGIKRVMVEGGATIINEILAKYQKSVDSLIVTIAPIFLGQGGVAVMPERQEAARPAVLTRDVSYLPLDQDIVLCGRMS